MKTQNVFAVSFDKTFAEGIMKGMTIRASVVCPTWKDADDFAKLADGKTSRGVPHGGAKAVWSRAIVEAAVLAV